jgi:FkbM family methyltransferase
MLVKKIFNFLSNFHNYKIYKYSNNLKFDVFIDIGCHEGEFISKFLKNKKIKKFYCFEPNEFLFKKLITKFRSNKRIILSNNALGENKAIKKLFLSKLSYNSSLATFNKKSKYLKFKNLILNDNVNQTYSKVKQVSFDEYFKNKKIDNSFLKLDVEGYEYNVLRGAPNKIKDIKYILIEHQFSNQYKNSFNKVKDLIEKNNFRLIKNFYYPLFHYKDMLFFNQTYDI